MNQWKAKGIITARKIVRTIRNSVIENIFLF